VGWADTVIFSNGARLEGQIVKEDAQQVTIAVDGGNITVQRSEIASIVKEEPERPATETLQAYGKKTARWMDDVRDTNRGVIETASGLADGRMSRSVALQAFDQYEQAYASFQQQLDQVVPPAELRGVHALLLEVAGKRIESCRLFRRATEQGDDTLYHDAAAPIRESTALMEEAVEQFDAALGIVQ